VESQLAGVLIQPTNSSPVFSIPQSVIIEAVDALRSFSNAVMFQNPQGLMWFIRRYFILSRDAESYLLAFPKITKSPSQSCLANGRYTRAERSMNVEVAVLVPPIEYHDRNPVRSSARGRIARVGEV
jgi:hypothetical protein